MYCANCGASVAENLNYCKSCGNRIERNPLVMSNSSSHDLSRTLSLVVVMGVIGFVAVLKIILDNGRLDMPATVMILVAFLSALTIISAMIIGHMWKTAGDFRVHPRRNELEDEYVSPRTFRGRNTNQLGEPDLQPVSSVTDSTTKTLDQVPIARR